LREQWLAQKVRCGKAVSTCIPIARNARNVGATDFRQRVESGMLRNATVLARAKGKRFAPRLRAPFDPHCARWLT